MWGDQGGRQEETEKPGGDGLYDNPCLSSPQLTPAGQVILLAAAFILCWTPYAVLAVVAVLGTLITNIDRLTHWV